MKRSEILKDIASELVHEHTNFMSFDKAQELAEIILNRIEKAGMLPPKAWIVTNPNNTKFPELQNVKELVNEWEPE